MSQHALQVAKEALAQMVKERMNGWACRNLAQDTLAKLDKIPPAVLSCARCGRLIDARAGHGCDFCDVFGGGL